MDLIRRAGSGLSGLARGAGLAAGVLTKTPEERMQELLDKLAGLRELEEGEERAIRLTTQGRVIFRPVDNLNELIGAIQQGQGIETGSDLITSEILRGDVYDASALIFEHRDEAEERGLFFDKVLTEEAEEGLLRCGIDLRPMQIYSAVSLEKAIRESPETAAKHCLWNTMENALPDGGTLALTNIGLKAFSAAPAKKRTLAKIASLYNIRIRLHQAHAEEPTQTYTYNSRLEEHTQIRVGLFRGHFFLTKNHFPEDDNGYPVDLRGLISSGALGTTRHNEVGRGSADFRWRSRYRTPSISTFALLRKLASAGYLRTIPHVISIGLGLARVEQGLKQTNPFIDELFIPTPQSEPLKQSKSKGGHNYTMVWYSDFETLVGKYDKHIPYLACAVPRGGGQRVAVCNPGNIKLAERGSPIEIGKLLLTKIVRRHISEHPDVKPKILLYFHNLRYDANFLYGCLKGTRSIESGGRMYELSGQFEMVYFGKKVVAHITVHDTWAFIQSALSKFPEMFKIDGGKWEDVPYAVFTVDRMRRLSVPSGELKRVELKHFAAKYIQNGLVNLYRYSTDYCEQDCRVLQQGFDQFREASMELGLDIDNHLTAASLAKAYIIKEGALDNVNPLTGTARAYTQLTVVGGRVCIRGNKPLFYESTKPEDDLVDLDAVSLYPSAMCSMRGFPIGDPIKFEGAPPAGDTFYIATVRLSALPIELHFSTLSKETKDGREWGKGSVKLGDIMVLNKLQIESAQRHQDAEFEYIGGLTWPEGYSSTICDVIKRLFEWRLRLKKEGNPLELTVKLIMNATYGKLIERPHDSRIVWFSATEEEALKKAAEAGSGYVYLEQVEIRPDAKYPRWKLKYNVPQFNHANYAHCGGQVLAASKEIMYQVTTPLDDVMCYTDTDSTIIPKHALQRLPTTLIGKNMGQFHTDLKWKYEENYAGHTAEPTAKVGLFLAKKTYALELHNIAIPGETQTHLRAKGIPNKTLLGTARRANLSPMDLFKKIRDDGVDFNLILDGVRFKQHPTSIVTMNSFHRKLGPYINN